MIHSDTRLWATGCNKYGQLGQGTKNLDFSKQFLVVEVNGTICGIHCMSESFILHSKDDD